MSVALDASALLAVLLDEPGSDEVIGVMRGSVMSAVNASECFARAVDKGFAAQSVLALLHNFEIEVVPFDSDQALATAGLRSATRSVGASLGDRACLALGMERGCVVYTGDRRLAGLGLGIGSRLVR